MAKKKLDKSRKEHDALRLEASEFVLEKVTISHLISQQAIVATAFALSWGDFIGVCCSHTTYLRLCGASFSSRLL